MTDRGFPVFSIQKKKGINRLSIKKFINTILEWIIVLFLVEEVGGLHFLREDSFFQNHTGLILLFTMAVFLLWCVFNCSNKNLFTREKIIIVIILICSALMTAKSLISNPKFAIMRVYLPVFCGISAMVLISKESIMRVMRKFVMLVVIIAIIALLFWFLGTLFHIISSNGSIQFKWDESHTANSFYSLYFEPDWQRHNIFGTWTYKNCGIFAEPPMFGYLLSLAYFFERISSQKKRETLIICLLCFCTVITSTSLTALIAIVIFEMVFLGCKQSKGQFKSLLKYFAFFIIFLIATYISVNLVSDKLDSASGGTRQDHLRVSLSLFFSNLISGVGFGNDAVFESMEKYKQGISIGMPAVWAQGGFGAFLLTTFPIVVSLFFSFIYHNWKMMAFTVAITWIHICTSIYFQSPITWILSMYICRDDIYKIKKSASNIVISALGLAGIADVCG